MEQTFSANRAIATINGSNSNISHEGGRMMRTGNILTMAKVLLATKIPVTRGLEAKVNHFDEGTTKDLLKLIASTRIQTADSQMMTL